MRRYEETPLRPGHSTVTGKLARSGQVIDHTLEMNGNS
jgi:hypothetical protein